MTVSPRRGMVVTVGTGTRPDVDMSEPLSKSIREANPDMVVLVFTEGSRETAQRIKERVGGPPPMWLEECLSNGDDIEEAFHASVRAIRRLMDLGLSAEAITADYTSGTKAMTAGLALAAVTLRCGSLRYIAGRRKAGVVVSGTERFAVTPPSAVLALLNLSLAEEMIRSLQFDAAQRLCEGVNVHLLLEEDRRRKEALLLVAQAYGAWDRFQHHKAKDLFEKAKGLPVPEAFQVGSEVLQRLRGLGDAAHQGRFSDDLLAELLANACRRMLEGRWDDAVGRLYRSAEFLAQKALKERYGQDTGDLDPSRLPEEARAALGPLQSSPEDKVLLGLEKAYRLLEALGHPMGQKFKELRGLLQERNQSLLAHGTRPVKEESARHFLRVLVALGEQEVPDLRQRVHALQFPWLRKQLEGFVGGDR